MKLIFLKMKSWQLRIIISGKILLKLWKWSISYANCIRILCIACKMLNKMTFDQRSKMLINHFGRRRFLRGELRSIAGLIFLPKSYSHYVNEWFNSVIKWDTGKSKLVARFLKHFKRMIKSNEEEWNPSPVIAI